ncbi:MAG: response regulator transcription factor [Hymenobacter sp.]|nr:MAG: response regulator transcription factor [Hymenobacter sp.]
MLRYALHDDRFWLLSIYPKTTYCDCSVRFFTRMNVLIVEDETTAALSLQRLLAALRPTFRLLGPLESVAESVAWLEENAVPDLIFMDIHLADGSSFEIFRSTTVTSPVIFTTAYDEHALEAFQANGIDYLLKPLSRASLQRSLDKLDALRLPTPPASLPDFAQLLRTMQQLGSSATSYKNNWLVPFKTKLVPVSTKDVAYFAIRNGLVVLTTLADQEYPFDQPLDELESQVDPQLFFRANRQVLLTRASIVELESYFNGRLLVHLRPPAREEVVVSKLRVADLKRWLNAG